MAVWSVKAQRPGKGVRQQEGGVEGAAPQRGRGEGSQAVFRQGTRAGRSRAQRGPGEHEARSAGPCTARGKTRSPRGAGGRVSPPAPRGSSATACGCGRSPRFAGWGDVGVRSPPGDRAENLCSVLDALRRCNAVAPSPQTSCPFWATTGTYKPAARSSRAPSWW